MKVKWIALLAGTLIAAAPLSTVAADMPATYKKNCLSCHGKDGKANTKAGRKAKTKDLTDKKYQSEFTDAEALKSILEGVQRDGKEVMKSYKDKLTEAEAKELVAFIRTFAQ